MIEPVVVAEKLDPKIYFARELRLIGDLAIREFVEKVLLAVPEYFFIIPASSTGKYHPTYALGAGGLARHVRAAVWIAVELTRMEDYTPHELDVVVASLLLHDCLKNGKENGGATLAEHPILMSQFIKDKFPDEKLESLDEILSCIETHMGRWITNYKGEVVLKKPETRLQKIVHLADYIASRKQLEFNFNI
jgi:succinate dehydrogenase flavin-adding protein (antitoxin of CptAB toxin-antitoxin module)